MTQGLSRTRGRHCPGLCRATAASRRWGRRASGVTRCPNVRGEECGLFHLTFELEFILMTLDPK